MSWTEHPIHFLDFEGSRASGVLEYGVAVLQRGAIIETHTRVCRAIGRVSDADAAVHGLREAEVASASPFTDEWDRFADLRERGPFAAHYAGVETALLKAAWPYPRASADFARPGETVIEWGPWIDTAALYRQLYPTVGTGRLEALVVAAGVQGQLDALAAQHCPPTRRRYTMPWRARCSSPCSAAIRRSRRSRCLSCLRSARSIPNAATTCCNASCSDVR